ncbi:hypothetical protein DFJ77DRAFT_445682 [Powellomyces hirtus]|nr:hypothetical protein DFJ77DRAFT_445682 [Powellomyces hirtus]
MAALMMQGANEMDMPSKQSDDAGHFLPRVPTATSRGPALVQQVIEEPSSHPKHRTSESPQYRYTGRSGIPGNVELLQTMLRERDLELLRLRHENSLLKQIERRQQKDIEQLEWHSEERVIHALRDEVTGLKHKLKLYFTQLSSNARELRRVSEDRQRLKEQNDRLEKLATDRHLAEREQLNDEVEALTKRVAQLDRIAGDAVRRAELTEKNMLIDNRHLRARVHGLEKDITDSKEKSHKLEDVIKDREKEICSLEIYRYNAVHRKNDTVCKNCQHQDVDANERKRKADISGKLPTLQVPEIGNITATTVEVTYHQPYNTNVGDHIVEYTRLTLSYSSDAHMQSGVQKIDLPIVEAAHDGGAHAYDKHKGGDGRAGHQKVETNKSRKKAKELGHEAKYALPGRVSHVKVGGLEHGTRYYFQLLSGHLDVDGTPTRPVEATTAARPGPAPNTQENETSSRDAAPSTPSKLSVERLAETTLRIVADVKSNEEHVRRYRLVTMETTNHDTRDSIEETGRSVETELEIPCITDLNDEEFSHVVEDLKIGSSFSFKFQCENDSGWSSFSEWSDPILISQLTSPEEAQPETREPIVAEPDDSEVINAAAIALPPSPLPPLETSKPAVPAPADEETPSVPTTAEAEVHPPELSESLEMGKLSKANSKTGSNLTLDQRVENMHHGLPAHFEPPVKVDA